MSQKMSLRTRSQGKNKHSRKLELLCRKLLSRKRLCINIKPIKFVTAVIIETNDNSVLSGISLKSDNYIDGLLNTAFKLAENNCIPKPVILTPVLIPTSNNQE